MAISSHDRLVLSSTPIAETFSHFPTLSFLVLARKAWGDRRDGWTKWATCLHHRDTIGLRLLTWPLFFWGGEHSQIHSIFCEEFNNTILRCKQETANMVGLVNAVGSYVCITERKKNRNIPKMLLVRISMAAGVFCALFLKGHDCSSLDGVF